MYLEHFGLNEPPFKITPVTEFFFAGADRQETLDALIHAITREEGIVKVCGEVGSGKTMLCRMLLNLLPTNIKTIYLANPSLSREELLYAIAEGLELDPEGQRISTLLQNLHNHLVAKHNNGESCVVLVDEAHAMPTDTLEELRLLYNLQIGKHKLVQIALFGQPELNAKLEQSNMRQLKDRIVHHFTMQPLSKKNLGSYLMFRMHTAGYQGADIFSPEAIELIDRTAHGLLRRVNVLADKSLLAAFVENTHRIETRHVQAAIRDSGMVPDKHGVSRKAVSIAAGSMLLLALLAGIGLLLGRSKPPENVAEEMHSSTVQSGQPPAAPVAAPPAVIAMPPPASAKMAATPAIPPLFKARLAATKAMMASPDKGGFAIQLYLTDDASPARLERFLVRAKAADTLKEIYILPLKPGNKDGFRIVYGNYPDEAAARAGIQQLPQRYQDSFSLQPYKLEN